MKTIIKPLMLLVLALCLQGCESFTETNMPVSELGAQAAFEEKGTATAAMTDVYARIRENGMLSGKVFGASRMLGLYADELSWWGSPLDDAQRYYNNTLLPATPMVTTWWNDGYSAIYAANAVIEGLDASTMLAEADRDQLMGEALFARSLMHFYLMQVYGPIPYITTTDHTVNVRAHRMPEDMVYGQVIADLETAASLLPVAYVGEFRVRPNTFAARALLARVCLYRGDWAAASNHASAVLNETGTYIWQADVSGVFLKESSSAIWQFSPRTAVRNTDEASTFIFNAGPPPQVALSDGLMAAFEPGDTRRTLWTRSRTNGTDTWYHAYKYRKTGSAPPQTEFPIVLRMAEQYLIRAEARARQGELIGAKEDLDRVRTRAGLGGTIAVTQEELVTAILRERRVEFFTEYGHRFFDLKRTGQLDATLGDVKASWNSTDRVLPLPERELQLNPNMAPQNQGY